MGEIKQTNFRIDNETADKFRVFCEENGYNQAKGFDYLMEVLQTTKAKEYAPERLVEIEEFEMHSKAILSAFLRSVETAKNTEVRVREDFVADLEKKARTITKLENEAEQYKQEVKEAEVRAKEAIALQKQAENEATQAKKLQEKAEAEANDKKELYEASQKQLKEALDKLDEYPGLKASNEERAGKIAKLQQELKDTKREAEISQERAVSEIQKAMDKALADAEKKLDKAASDAEKDKDKALADLERAKDKKISELEIELSKAQTMSAGRQEQLSKLEEKNDLLQEKMAELKAQVAELKAQKEFLEKQLTMNKESEE